MKRYWLCRKCGTRWPRTTVKCATNGCTSRRPPARVPAHARTLRDDSYQVYVDAAAAIHGVTDESCCVCGKPRSQERRHDRDHGHNKDEITFGKPRGLACVSCNRLMPRELTPERAWLIFQYLTRAQDYYSKEQAA